MSEWQVLETRLEGGRVRRLTLSRSGSALTMGEVITGWRTDAAFRAFYGTCLADCPFPAFFWEHPALTRTRLAHPYQCVQVDSPSLAAVHADPRPFAEELRSGCGAQEVVQFPNLSGDALLIAPCPQGAAAAHAHIGVFVRQAPAAQVDALLRTLGETLEARLDDRPLWVSTSGLGVSWLHVRLDARPKYYTFAPYRQARPEDRRR